MVTVPPERGALKRAAAFRAAVSRCDQDVVELDKVKRKKN
jgi:hypothetical protein